MKKPIIKVIIFVLTFLILIVLSGCVASFDYSHEIEAAQSIEECNELPGLINKEVCYKTLGEKFSDISICHEGDASLKSYCYTGVAVALKDLSICDKIETELNKDYSYFYECYAEVAEIKDDLSICDRIDEDINGLIDKYKEERPYLKDYPDYFFESNLRDYNSDKSKYETELAQCYGKLAAKRNNLDLCNNVLKTNVCLKKVAVELKDISICELPSLAVDSLDPDRDSCLRDVARVTRDSSICRGIGNINVRDACYLWVVWENPELSTCKFISGSSSKNDCYNSVARNTGDIEICEKIEKNNDLKKYCLKSLGIDSDEDLPECPTNKEEFLVFEKIVGQAGHYNSRTIYETGELYIYQGRGGINVPDYLSVKLDADDWDNLLNFVETFDWKEYEANIRRIESESEAPPGYSRQYYSEPIVHLRIPSVGFDSEYNDHASTKVIGETRSLGVPLFLQELFFKYDQIATKCNHD